MLIVFGGLPGTGKTTIARHLADRLGATYFRIDAIEQALRSTLGLGDDLGSAGYDVAYALSEANLALGRTIVADCVNPLPVTRLAWRGVAARTATALFEVELICSDAAEHRRRIESREIDLPGLVPPAWADVMARDYAPWTGPRIVVDTARLTAADAVLEILGSIGRRPPADPDAG